MKPGVKFTAFEGGCERGATGDESELPTRQGWAKMIDRLEYEQTFILVPFLQIKHRSRIFRGERK